MNQTNKSVGWNPWHGCHKLSPGCKNCYVYRIDRLSGRDSSIVTKTADFSKPLFTRKSGEHKISSGTTVYTCFSSDFFVEDADQWRTEAWQMIAQRSDLDFFIITKRIDRFYDCIPPDWGNGYKNVTLCCTVENQNMADYRLPIFLEAPIRHRQIICEPLLEHIELEHYLGGWIEKVIVGGESGENARICDFSWVKALAFQCRNRSVPFYFKQTGANFLKDGTSYSVVRSDQAPLADRLALEYMF